ncbi:hypothetical protein F5148DRAFT_1158884 [Russula earlei]|uniref:Uncharacterized protein n=1 Tax=Russula earlei TaxID=71964 RepID=A0ACC0UN58_9AGAM|nr:hypothetical protein F5148DRAFT_1158884 [Russula earlei]
MSSLVNYSAFYAVEGVKSPNMQLTWRPYDSEQTMSTLEELLGTSELNYCPENIYVDGEEEAKTQLATLMKWLEPLIRPVSIEEDQRKLLAFLKFPTNLDHVTNDTFDYGTSNVLLTRAERHRSSLPSGTCFQGDCEKWERSGRIPKPQSPERSKPDNPLEDGCHAPRSAGSINSSPSAHGYALLSDPSEGEHRPPLRYSSPVLRADVALHADVVIIPATQAQPPVETVVSMPSTILCQDPVSIPIPIPIPETSNSSSPSWIYSSKNPSLDYSRMSASPGLVACEEQTLGFTSPTQSELQRPSVDTEGILCELSRLATPLPSLKVSPHRNHRYLASVELLQDRPLMRALHLDSLRLELLEREWLDGADIVFDCDAALVFAPMFRALLHANFRSFKTKLSSLSWRYTHLAVVFQLYDCAFSGSVLHCPLIEEEQANLLNRVIKSIKKLHRELALAEAYGTKRPQTVIEMYFVRTIEEAATAARLFGDMAESRSRFGPWGDRLWLAVDEKEVSLTSLFCYTYWRSNA